MGVGILMRVNKDTYNYKEVFDAPMQIKRLFFDYSLPGFVSMARIGYAGLILLVILLFFQPLVDFLDSIIPVANLLIYTCVPWFGSKYIMKISPDGKSIPVYLKDIVSYYVTIGIPKKRYYHDEPLQFSSEVVFTNYKIIKERKEGEADATSNTTEEIT